MGYGYEMAYASCTKLKAGSIKIIIGLEAERSRA